MPPDNALSLNLPAELLKPLVQQVVAETLAALEADRQQLGDKLACGEAEAARLLGLAQHQLRDERLRSRIQASVGPGRRIMYTRQDLLNYLQEHRWKPAP
jgi:hypothetical protein